MHAHPSDLARKYPHATTVYDPRDRQRRLAAQHAQAKARLAVRMPSHIWEDSGLHGEGKQVHLRSRHPLAHGRTPRTALAGTSLSNLPALPSHGITTKRVVVAAAVVGTVALGVYLWKRSKQERK